MSYVLVIHGGAGTIKAGGDEAPYHAGLQAALAAGEAILKSGGSAQAAVVAAAMALEDCPLFNAGHGAVFTSAAEHELDAALMDGVTLRAGAVATVRRVKNPILVAQAVLEEGRCVLLGGEAADEFAEQAGLQMVANDYFSTVLRRTQLAAVQSAHPQGVALDHSAPTRFGTIGAVALDLHGNLAAATSTGGMTNKRPGRIGDSPLIGSGTYANNATCAVSATGTGEHFIRACVAFDVHARMHYGHATTADAAYAAIHQSLQSVGGEGGIIVVGRDGTVAMPFNSVGMYRGLARQGHGAQTHIF
jgi:beta-aspartyl-peptidase (threonine type)